MESRALAGAGLRTRSLSGPSRTRFYHATQYLAQIAALRQDWSAKARTPWRTGQRHLLLKEEVDQMITVIR